MWHNIWQDKRIIGSILVLLILLVAVPLTLQQSQKPQDIRQHAASGAATACSVNNPVDTMLLIDKSGSMGPPVNTDDRIDPAKAAAKNFVNILYQNGAEQPKKSQVGVVSFAQLDTLINGRTQLDAPLTLLSTQANADAVNSKIQAITIFGRTCIECAVRLANQEILAHGRPGVKKVAILLTDGGANAYGDVLNATQADAEKAADAAVDLGHRQSGTIFFTIGLGTDVNTTFLQNIASRTGGKYYFAPTASDLNAIYDQISTIVGKGAMSGTVFRDANHNAIRDAGEVGLPGWEVTATDADGNTLATVMTDQQGNYNFTGLCDGSYQIKLSLQPGWVQIAPPDGMYSETISNSSSLPGRDFAVNPEPTPTPTVVPTTASVTLLLHGLGHSGDNANPNSYALSNENPVHTTRPVRVQLFDQNNTKVADAQGSVTYNSINGNFTGSVDLGTNIASGPYTVKITSDGYLTRQLPGIVRITAHKNHAFTATLVTGDTNNDNALNILDYNEIISCYTDFQPAVACNQSLQRDADLTDDNHVNQYDYNLFLRDLSVQNGD